MKNYLIIGGAGFLGSHIVKTLIDKQAKITVSDIIGPEYVSKIKQHMNNINYIWKSTEDLKEQDLTGIDCVIFLAAQADVPLVLSSPKYSFYSNISGLINVL